MTPQEALAQALHTRWHKGATTKEGLCRDLDHWAKWLPDALAILDALPHDPWADADRLAEALIECEQGHHGEHCVDDISWRDCDWWGHKPSAAALAQHDEATRPRQRERLLREGWHAPRPDCGPIKATPHSHSYSWGSTGSGTDAKPPTGQPCLGCGHRFDPEDDDD